MNSIKPIYSVYLSIVVPLYNEEESVEKLVAQIVEVGNQFDFDYEIILVDDGSTDNTAKVLAKFSNELTYVKQNNRGPSAARNKGISLSRGKYLTFLDSDALFLPNHLEELLVS